jgi:hypothetical protein
MEDGLQSQYTRPDGMSVQSEQGVSVYAIDLLA